jgi:predicted NBD/HSP70 family sugar kinase
MRVGTGVGGACVDRRQIEPSLIGFEPGHQVIDLDPVTLEYRTLEYYVGGAMIRQREKRHPKDVPRHVYNRLTPYLACGVWNAIDHWRPDVVVLGGGVMNEANGFRINEVRVELEKIHAQIGVIPELPPIVAGELGDDAALMGATLLFDIVR